MLFYRDCPVVKYSLFPLPFILAVHAMTYAKRNAAGEIESLHNTQVPGSTPVLPDDPAVSAFIGGTAEPRDFLSLDTVFVRVLEDLVDVLIERNVIRITDLPPEAQQKLLAREYFRGRLRSNSLKLLPDE
jgi:hypothetical protein